jgi:hypothetical protein
MGHIEFDSKFLTHPDAFCIPVHPIFFLLWALSAEYGTWALEFGPWFLGPFRWNTSFGP